MNIALIGASGFIGSGLRNEALSRGHRVTALVAHPEKLAAGDGLTVIGTDVFDTRQLTEQLTGHDAVISAFSGHAQESQEEIRSYYVRGVESILTAVKKAGVSRLLMVGGAGSLQTSSGVQVVDTPDFPAQWKGSALGARDVLARLREEPELDWTFLSPAAKIGPGERTGRFRLGSDQLLVDESGNSRISVEDYAVAMIDELERPAHSRMRFCVAY